MSLPFHDRLSAARELAQRLLKYRKKPNVIVLAMPRGGVPVAAEIARALQAPLDIIVVRKLGTPNQEELAMGAVGSGGVRVLNDDIVSSLGIADSTIDDVATREEVELERRMTAYRGQRPWPELEGKHVILVDDGIATGATMRAAIAVADAHGAAKIIVAVPVAPIRSLARFHSEADEVVCLATPEPFRAVGVWYASFPQLADADVSDELAQYWTGWDAAGSEQIHEDRRTRNSGIRRAADTKAIHALAARPTHEEELTIRAGAVSLAATLRLPGPAHGLVVFARGSGSSRSSPRNRYVAECLNEVGLATLLFDLLTPSEQQRDAQSGELRFDIPFLTERLARVVDWARTRAELHALPIGLFGASTGAAAALNVAADRAEVIAAVVSRGGRPDLAQAALARVRAPTLLIVGELDELVIDLNHRAAAKLACEHRVDIVPGASHLFEEPGKLEQAARLAREWLDRHLRVATADFQPAAHV